MRPMQSIVSVTSGRPVRLRRYLVDWLGNLKFMGEAHVIPPQADDFNEAVEAFRIGNRVAESIAVPGMAA